jgi:hypothetical protein
MENRDCIDDIHMRILRVVEDLRVIQRDLNFAAMQAPGDPELLEALNELPELETIEVLKSALDQMRHFLWFYVQVVTNEMEIEDPNQVSKALAPEKIVRPETTAALRFPNDDLLMFQHLADSKNRKPN